VRQCGWSHDGDVIAAIDIDDELDLGLKLAILDICWRAGMVELYGRIARRLVRALPIMVVSLLPAQVTPLEAVARLEAVLDARVDKDLGPARGAIERLAFKQIGNLPLAQRHRAIRLLELLPDIGYSNTISSQRPSEIIAGIYHQFLERAYPSDALPASTILPPDGSLVIADAFGPLLREWTALRQAEASEAEAARGAAVQRENELLQQRVEDIDGEKAILRRDLEEARSLHKEHAAQDAAETSLPWIEQVYTLADDIDRLLAGDHGDYETLVWTREQVHDLLARHGVDVVGAIGERIHFDAALHEYVGPVGETYEWYEIMESGYILNNLDQAPTVLKRIPVRGVVS